MDKKYTEEDFNQLYTLYSSACDAMNDLNTENKMLRQELEELVRHVKPVTHDPKSRLFLSMVSAERLLGENNELRTPNVPPFK